MSIGRSDRSPCWPSRSNRSWSSVDVFLFFSHIRTQRDDLVNAIESYHHHPEMNMTSRELSAGPSPR